MTKETYYAVKASDAGILPWTIASHMEETISLWEKAVGLPFAGALEAGDKIVCITITESQTVLSLKEEYKVNCGPLFDAMHEAVNKAGL